MTNLFEEIFETIDTFGLESYSFSKVKLNGLFLEVFLQIMSERGIIAEELFLSKSIPFRRYPLPTWYTKMELGRINEKSDKEVVHLFEDLVTGISLYDLVHTKE